MSNAMRFGKRTLAGVAAGALALGALTIASAPAASAKPSIKPKVAVTGTVSAVRAGAISSIPYARLSFSKSIARPTTLLVVTSPAGGRMWIDDTAGAQPASTDDSATLTSPRNISTGVVFNNTATIGTSDDSTVGIAVDTAGSYTAQIGNGSDTVTFTFTTAGAPASLSLTPASQTVLVGQTAELALTVKDSAGNNTQIAYGDSIQMSDNTDDTVSPTAFTAGTIYRGTGVVSLNTALNPAGTTTVTATPAGTLPSLGVTAQTATVTKSGTISASAVVNMTVAAPTTALNTPETGNNVNRTTQIPANTTNVVVAVDDTSANPAGTQLRFGINLNQPAITAGASVDGRVITATDDTVFVLVTTDSSRKANVAFTLGGGAINTGAVITVSQVTVNGALVTPKITISQLAPQVYGANVVASPDDSVVAKLGDKVPVTVTVDDSFGTPQAGWVVRALRNNSVIVSTGTTGPNGKASLELSQAATAVNGTVERFTYEAFPPVGTSVTGTSGTQVTWTTSGGVNSLTVTANANTPTSLTDVAQTSTKGGAILVPSAGVLSGAPTAVQFTIATGLDDTTVGRGNYAQFSAVTSPLSSITYTTPEGVFVTDDTTDATWSNGVRTLTVSSTTPVFVYATKTGVHDVTITSGGKTVTAKVKASTVAANAYNIALTPAKQNVGSGAIGTVTLKVTDIFGNAVQTSTTSGQVTVSASGEVLLAGFDTSRSYTTNASGEATITFIAGNSAGAGLLTAVPATGDGATAWQTGYTRPTGAPAPVTSTTAEVAVGSAPATKSITITGSRTTVSGKPGIKIEGAVTGIENGKTVIPYFRFPGETTFAQGSARPVITDGSFTWQRKTGKKFYAYVTSDDGAVKSNRVIIPAN